MSDSANKQVDNGSADAVAATALIALTILVAIDNIYTGGLLAFIEKVF